MSKIGKTFTVLIVYVCLTVLSACSGNAVIVPAPVDVIFDSQREEFLFGSYLSTDGVIGLLVTSVLMGAATGIVLIQLSSNMDVHHTSENEKDIG